MSQIGILYSSETGVVLRKINTDDPDHLAWLEQNKPEGTSLLRINKNEVGADDDNMPNLDVLIPWCKEHKGVDLRFGVHCAVVDPDTNEIIDTVLACPKLFKKRLDAEAKKPGKKACRLVEDCKGQKGDLHDPVEDKFYTKEQHAKKIKDMTDGN